MLLDLSDTGSATIMRYTCVRMRGATHTHVNTHTNTDTDTDTRMGGKSKCCIRTV
mgnify:CR=1 FL=1